MDVTVVNRVNYLSFRQAKLYFVSLVFVLSNLIIPALFHRLGINGQIFLPLYSLTLIGGMTFGWRCGLITGLVSPLASFYFSGLPAVSILPFVIFKSSLIGLSAGVLAGKLAGKNYFYVSSGAVIFTQLVGSLLIFLSTGNSKLSLADITVGYPGLLFQLIFIPLVINSLRKNAA